MIKKAQAILEFALAFIIMAVLIAGLLNIWSWSNNNIIWRQGNYEGSRVAAGNALAPGEPEVSFNAKEMKDGSYLFKK